MSNKKAILTYSISILLTHYSYSQKLKLILYNKSEYTIDSLYIENYFIGTLRRGDSVLIKNYKELVVQGGLPLNRLQGCINGKPCVKNLLKCGTKSKKLKSGLFKYEIHCVETDNSLRLYWKKHSD